VTVAPGIVTEGFVQIAGKTYGINQDASDVECSYSISPVQGDFDGMSNNTHKVAVTTSNADCAWSTSNDLAWVQLSPESEIMMVPIILESNTIQPIIFIYSNIIMFDFN
jgi:hypothetical protein